MKSDGILGIHDVNCRYFFYGLKLLTNDSVVERLIIEQSHILHPKETIVEFKWSPATLFYPSMATTRSETHPL
jgi:hypothetical protein